MHIHRHVSRKVMEANRKNSQHSHGPTTTRGKETVRNNAVRHGLLARALVFRNDKEEKDFRVYRRRLREDVAPEGGLEIIYFEDVAIAEWRLARATRWEQRIKMGHGTRDIVDDALQSGAKKLGMMYLPGVEDSRGWRCKELAFSLQNDKDSEYRSHTSSKTPEQAPPYGQKSDRVSGDRGGVELSAKLTDPLDDLDIILRYQRAIRKDRDNAVDRLLRLQEARAKPVGKSAREASDPL